jgi:uncharacterized protein YdeI (YjbR/CyaY-like superfamily)
MAAIIVDEKKVRSFASEAAFEAWLAKHHARETELWLKVYKKGSGVPSITIAQALDVVLCWGWIDGVRKSFDEVCYLQRYTPRKSRSVWSQINRDNVARLIAAGRMTPHGQRQVDLAKADGRWQAAYAPSRNASPATLPPDLLSAIQANGKAAAALQTLGRQNLFALAFRTNHMKTPAGRARKIEQLVAMLARGETIGPQARKPVKPEKTAAKTVETAKTETETAKTKTETAKTKTETTKTAKPARTRRSRAE